jgi:hypothetical protein
MAPTFIVFPAKEDVTGLFGFSNGAAVDMLAEHSSGTVPAGSSRCW